MNVDLAALQRGDKTAWDGFVSRFAGVIHAAVLGVLRQGGSSAGNAGWGEVGDIVQDVFVRLCKDQFRLIGLYDPARASLVTWLTVVTRSVALDHLRRRRIATETLDDAPEAALAVPPQEPTRITIPPGLLSPRQALILTLIYDHDQDPAEIAARLAIDAQTVRSMHHKALTKLRKHFDVNGGDG